MPDDPSRPESHALLEALSRGAADWADPRVPALLVWMRAGQRRSELQALLRSSAGSLGALSPAHACALVELLRDMNLVQLAYAVTALPQLTTEPEVAALRARLAMHLHEYPAAIAASELAIAALLQPGLSIDEFLRRCSAGAPPEGMLRFERHRLAERVHLSERLALRWEALHRAGMSRDASLMQLMCQRYFPERASVWATAGNHALDADDLTAAEGYFQRCLQLEPNWTAGLAGLAIVCERRKDWAAALPFRRRVLEVERALEQQDAASVQRRLRYAAALARLGRWREAEPLFRAAARSSALLQLPAEQPVLLRVFSQNLYAPTLVAALQPAVSEEPAISLAQHEAALLEQLMRVREPRDPSDAPAQRWWLGLCAYLSGELERAYELLDQAEDDRPDDLAVQYLLWRCASAIDHPQTASIRAFAEQAARAASEPSSQQRDYVAAILPELQQLTAAATGALEELEPVQAPALAQLERIVAFRALHEAAGRSPLIAAAASTLALAALAEQRRDASGDCV